MKKWWIVVFLMFGVADFLIRDAKMIIGMVLVCGAMNLIAVLND